MVLTVFIRVVLLYVFSVAAMRLMGKRQVGQLQPYELVLALMVAEIAAAPMEDVAVPLLHGLVPILGLMVLHGICTALSLKSPAMRRVLNGVPGVVIQAGCVDGRQMKRMGYTVTDLLEDLRCQGYDDVSQVHTAVLETNGKLSVFPKARYAPVTCSDLKLSKTETASPYLLIADGRVQEKPLQESGHDPQWLAAQLERAGILSEKKVLLASLNGEGLLFIQPRNARPSLIQSKGGQGE